MRREDGLSDSNGIPLPAAPETEKARALRIRNQKRAVTISLLFFTVLGATFETFLKTHLGLPGKIILAPLVAVFYYQLFSHTKEGPLSIMPGLYDRTGFFSYYDDEGQKQKIGKGRKAALIAFGLLVAIPLLWGFGVTIASNPDSAVAFATLFLAPLFMVTFFNAIAIFVKTPNLFSKIKNSFLGLFKQRGHSRTSPLLKSVLAIVLTFFAVGFIAATADLQRSLIGMTGAVLYGFAIAPFCLAISYQLFNDIISGNIFKLQTPVSARPWVNTTAGILYFFLRLGVGIGMGVLVSHGGGFLVSFLYSGFTFAAMGFDRLIARYNQNKLFKSDEADRFHPASAAYAAPRTSSASFRPSPAAGAAPAVPRGAAVRALSYQPPPLQRTFQEAPSL